MTDWIAVGGSLVGGGAMGGHHHNCCCVCKESQTAYYVSNRDYPRLQQRDVQHCRSSRKAESCFCKGWIRRRHS
jgi:hypothetical protein